MLRKGCTPEALRSWHRKCLDSQNPSIVKQQSDKERIKQLERENQELRQANEIIRKAAGIEAQAEKDRKPK